MHSGAVYSMHRHAADLREKEREMRHEDRAIVHIYMDKDCP